MSVSRSVRVIRHKHIPPRLFSTASGSSSLFPWRHSAEPIQRVVDKDNLSGLPIDSQKDSFFQQVMLGSMLHRDWYELLLPSVWMDSLANDCGWAFQKGLGALLSSVFKVPVNEIDKEDIGIIFDTEGMKSQAADEELVEEGEANETSEDTLCSLMLEKRLVELYASVDPMTTDLLLCMKPISSKLENIFSVIFTRETVEADDTLAEVGRKMRYESRVLRNPLEVSRLLKDLDEKGKPIGFFTIIADVSIHCLEAFAVKEKGTGIIVSGSTESQEVTHLVRFEVTTILDGKRRLGSWRIVDWDDLLSGNVWY